MKKNKYLIIISILLVILCLNIILVHADSGFDTSFDSGGVDFGDSDFGGVGISVGGSPIITIIIIIIVCISVFKQLKQQKELYKRKLSNSKLLAEKIKKEIPDFDHNEFLNLAYQIYLDVQDAWMNFDNDKLRTMLTDELYNSYVSQLKTLSIKKQKNIMRNFYKTGNFLLTFEKTEKEYVIKTELDVSFYDYIVDKDNKVVRGNNQAPIHVSYFLTFVRSISDKSNKCPNCNAPLSNNASNVCEYCKSVIINNNHGWILSKKENIKQS